MFWVEGVLYLDRYILDADGINGRRINHLRTEVTQFHRLYVREFVNGVGTLDHLRIGCHEAIHIGPNLKYLGIEYSSNDGCSVVRTTTTQIGRLMGVTVASHETWNNINLIVVQFLERLFHQLGGQVSINHMFALFLLCADKVA